MKIGLIGSGKWSKNYAKTLANKYRHIEVVTLSIREAISNSKLVASTTETIFNQIQTSNFDGIIIATQPQLQSTIAPHLIRSNIPLILEKPISLSSVDLESIVRSIQPESIVYVNFPFFFDNASNDFIYRAVKSEKFKKLYIVNGGNGPFRQYMSSFDDWAPHCFCAAIEALGPFENNQSIVQTVDTPNGQIYLCELTHQNNMKSKLIFGNGFKRRRQFFATVESINIEAYDPSSSKITMYEPRRANIQNEQPLDKLIQVFLNDIQNNTPTNKHLIHRAVDITNGYLDIKNKYLSYQTRQYSDSK